MLIEVCLSSRVPWILGAQTPICSSECGSPQLYLDAQKAAKLSFSQLNRSQLSCLAKLNRSLPAEDVPEELWQWMNKQLMLAEASGNLKLDHYTARVKVEKAVKTIVASLENPVSVEQGKCRGLTRCDEDLYIVYIFIFILLC